MTIILCGQVVTERPASLDRLPEVKRTRKILMILLIIVLVICWINFIVIIYSLTAKYRIDTYEPITILFWILYFAGGMLVTDRYYPTGLLIFACLGVINIILTCSAVVSVTVGVVILTSDSSSTNADIPLIVIPIVASITSVILDGIIVIFAFKLSRLITKNQHSIDQHVLTRC